MKQIMLEATVDAGDKILTFHAEMDEDDQKAYEAFVEFLTREGWEVMSIYKI